MKRETLLAKRFTLLKELKYYEALYDALKTEVVAKQIADTKQAIIRNQAQLLYINN